MHLDEAIDFQVLTWPDIGCDSVCQDSQKYDKEHKCLWGLRDGGFTHQEWWEGKGKLENNHTLNNDKKIILGLSTLPNDAERQNRKSSSSELTQNGFYPNS